MCGTYCVLLIVRGNECSGLTVKIELIQKYKM